MCPAAAGGDRLGPANRVQPVLGCAGIPELVELLQIEPRHGLVVDVRDTVPGIGAQAVHNGPVVGNEVGGGALASLRLAA